MSRWGKSGRHRTFRVCSAVCVLVLVVFAGPPVRAVDPLAFVTTTDFDTGSSSTVGYCPPYTHVNDVRSVYSDAVARFFDGLFYVVNRFGGDNIQILDPGNGFATARQFSVGVGSDPHDIEVLSPTKAYVTRYNSTDLWIVDPSTGTQTGVIDLSIFADPDGLPEMDHLARVGERVFVTIQRLDRNIFAPVGLSVVAVIDATADTLVDVDEGMPGVQAVELDGTNPFSSLQLEPWSGKLYVSCVNFFGLSDGGVEIIDPQALQSDGLLYLETVAGGDINDVEIVSSAKGYVVVSDASFNTVLKSFDPQSGTTLGTVFAPGGFVLNDIELSPKEELWLADRTPLSPGIRIFDVSNDAQITTSPIDVGLPPFDITFAVPLQTGVPEAGVPSLRLRPMYPNPFNPTTTISFDLTRMSRVGVSIYDVSGNLVRALHAGRLPAGRHNMIWDGRDDASRGVPSGVYFIRLDDGHTRLHQKVTLIK